MALAHHGATLGADQVSPTGRLTASLGLSLCRRGGNGRRRIFCTWLLPHVVAPFGRRTPASMGARIRRGRPGRSRFSGASITSSASLSTVRCWRTALWLRPMKPVSPGHAYRARCVGHVSKDAVATRVSQRLRLLLRAAVLHASSFPLVGSPKPRAWRRRRPSGDGFASFSNEESSPPTAAALMFWAASPRGRHRRPQPRRPARAWWPAGIAPRR